MKLLRAGAVGLMLAGPVSAQDLAAAFAAPNYGQLVAMLIQDFGRYDEACRGGSGDQTETWVACGSRDYASDLLYKFGWCYGETGQAAYQMDWHRCSATSIRNSAQ